MRQSTKNELKAIASEAQRRADGGAAVALHVSYAVGWEVLLAAITGNPLALLGGVRLEGEVDEKALRFRLTSILPGRGYRKLLSRIVAAENEYQAVDLALRNVWYRGGAS